MAEKNLFDTLSSITNPCGEIPLSESNIMQKMNLDVLKILNNQAEWIKNISTPPEESIPEDLNEYEKEISKNILIDHICENCDYSSCEKEQKTKYSTCSVWKERPLYGPNSVFQLFKKMYPSNIAGNIKPINDE